MCIDLVPFQIETYLYTREDFAARNTITQNSTNIGMMYPEVHLQLFGQASVRSAKNGAKELGAHIKTTSILNKKKIFN